MLKKILLASIFVITAITNVTHAEDDMKTVASKAYVDTKIETKQLKIPAAGQPNVGAGETVMTYTATGNGQIGERGLYSDISSYDATTDGDKLITASALNATFTNLPTTPTTKLECANQADGCTLWTIVDQTAYGTIIITNDDNIAPKDFVAYISEIVARPNQYSYDFTYSPSSSTGWYGISKNGISVTADHKYYVRVEMSSSVKAILSFSFGGTALGNGISLGKSSMTPNEMYLLHDVIIATETASVMVYLRCGYAEVGGPYTGKIHNIGIFDLTEIFGAGNEPATAEEAMNALVF